MKKIFIITFVLAGVNLIGWYYFSNSSELEDLRDQNQLLKAELDMDNKKSRRSPSSIQYKYIKESSSLADHSITDGLSNNKQEEVENTEDLTDKQKEILNEAYKDLPPHIVDQFKTKRGRDNMYKNLLNDPRLTKEMEKIEKLEPELSNELKDIFNEDDIELTAQTEKYLKESGDIPPDEALMKNNNLNSNNKGDGSNNLSSPNNSENNDTNLEN